jgi:hypothetical protein
MVFGTNEAFVINQLRVWIQECRSAKSVDGFRVAFMSRRSLKEQLPFIGEATLWRKVEKLEKIGVIRSYKGLSKGRYNRTKWYAIDDQMLKRCLHRHGTSKQVSLYHGDTNYYIEKEYFSLEKEGELSLAGDLPTGNFPEGVSGGEKMGKKELEKIHTDMVAKKLRKPLIIKPTKLAEYWRLQCSLNYEDMAKSKTARPKELGMWKNLIPDLPQGREKPFLAFAIDQWHSVTQSLMAYDDSSSAPTRPNVGYLLAHIHRLVHLFDDSTGSTEVIQSSKVNLSAQGETANYTPTYEEAMQGLGVSNDEHGGTSNSA